MTVDKGGIPKMHMIWFSTRRGFSNDDGAKDRIYYGKIFRIPSDIHATDKQTGVESIEQKELDDLQERFLNSGCVEGGTPAIGEVFERYDRHDPDTGDLVVMYRVPYKPSDEQPVLPATTPAPLSRHARRAAAKQGYPKIHLLPIPPNASQEARELVGRLLRLLAKHAPDRAFRLPASLAAEQRALALMTVAGHELSSMPPSSQRQAIITQMGAFLGWLVAEADEQGPPPEISKDDLDELIEQGIGTTFDLGPDDTDKSH